MRSLDRPPLAIQARRIGGRVSRRAAVLATVGVVLALLVIAQLVLPGIAAQRLRDQLARSGEVIKVEVSAFPAIELLWHQADSVTVHVRLYRSSTSELAQKLAQTADADAVDATADQLDTGVVKVHKATLRKRGDQLTGSAQVTDADIRAALPSGFEVRPVASGDGQLVLQGTATILGLSATLNATLRAQDGRLVVVPDVPFGGLATLTVFADPHIEVQGVDAASAAGGFTVTARAKLR
jgi:hypothetical protein